MDNFKLITSYGLQFVFEFEFIPVSDDTDDSNAYERLALTLYRNDSPSKKFKKDLIFGRNNIFTFYLPDKVNAEGALNVIHDSDKIILFLDMSHGKDLDQRFEGVILEHSIHVDPPDPPLPPEPPTD